MYVGTDTRFRVRLSPSENVSVAVREQNVLSTPDPTGYHAESDASGYAVWLKDAGRVLLD